MKEIKKVCGISLMTALLLLSYLFSALAEDFNHDQHRFIPNREILWADQDAVVYSTNSVVNYPVYDTDDVFSFSIRTSPVYYQPSYTPKPESNYSPQASTSSVYHQPMYTAKPKDGNLSQTEILRVNQQPRYAAKPESRFLSPQINTSTLPLQEENHTNADTDTTFMRTPYMPSQYGGIVMFGYGNGHFIEMPDFNYPIVDSQSDNSDLTEPNFDPTKETIVLPGYSYSTESSKEVNPREDENVIPIFETADVNEFDILPANSTLCLVGLGFQLNADGSMKPELIGRLEKLKTAADNYPDAIIVCTGGYTASNNNSVSEGGQMANWLISQGVDPSRILIESNAMSTLQNAENTLAMLAQAHPEITKIKIVTSDYHMSTGVSLFQSQASKLGKNIVVEAGETYYTY